jgi:hypothetical protein
MAPGADLTAHSPPARMPKLKYRIPLPAEEKSPLQDTRRDSTQQPSDVDDLPSIRSAKTPHSEYAQSFDTASLTSPSLASTASSVASSDDSRSSSKKKKKSGVLGFLSLKEPSQDAFKQYAEAQRKREAEKGTPSPSSSYRPMSSYSAKKLPKDIPKVNSKWDGVPESVKNRYPKSTTSTKKNRWSVQSQESQESKATARPSWNPSRVSVMTDGTRNPPNSVASPVPSMSSLNLRDGSRSSSPSPSTATLPEMSYYFPEPLEGTTAQNEQQPEAYHPVILESTPRSSSSPSDFGSSYDPVPDFRPGSPASSTGSADTVIKITAEHILNKLNGQPQAENSYGHATAVQIAEEIDEPTVPDSHDFLFNDLPGLEPSKAASPMSTPPIPHYAPTRSVHNFSRPMTPNSASPPARSNRPQSYRITSMNSGLPTLYEASLASNDSGDSDETVQDNNDDDSYSIAPSTVAPSELSAHWHDSPRERLDLGARLRMDAALPWEGKGDEPGKLKKYRLSIFGKVTPQA